MDEDEATCTLVPDEPATDRDTVRRDGTAEGREGQRSDRSLLTCTGVTAQSQSTNPPIHEMMIGCRFPFVQNAPLRYVNGRAVGLAFASFRSDIGVNGDRTHG